MFGEAKLDFCSSLFLLQLWENILLIVQQTARARSVRAFSVVSIVLDIARFRLCPRQLNQGQPKLWTAALMLLSLSIVTQDTLLSSNPQSCRASCKASAKLAAVWSTGKKIFWRYFDTSFHSVIHMSAVSEKCSTVEIACYSSLRTWL